ncbi:uncharacterized protein [Panulirus ornatus]|uniref:uncharacterized protein n=1 Tax=Panulirus ornatus TaxID=150431 RepID=UPI003A84DB69
MSISGTYVLTSNENYSEWLTGLGVPADTVAKMVAAQPRMEVKEEEGTEALHIKTIVGEKEFENTLHMGSDSKATLPGGIEFTLNLTLSGSTIKGTWALGSKSGQASVVMTASGATQTMTLGDVTAKRHYTRQ